MWFIVRRVGKRVTNIEEGNIVAVQKLQYTEPYEYKGVKLMNTQYDKVWLLVTDPEVYKQVEEHVIKHKDRYIPKDEQGELENSNA